MILLGRCVCVCAHTHTPSVLHSHRNSQHTHPLLSVMSVSHTQQDCPEALLATRKKWSVTNPGWKNLVLTSLENLLRGPKVFCPRAIWRKSMEGGGQHGFSGDVPTQACLFASDHPSQGAYPWTGSPSSFLGCLERCGQVAPPRGQASQNAQVFFP